jgi:predicted permease
MVTSHLFWVRVLARLPERRPDLERRLSDVVRREYARLPGAEGADLTPVGVRLLPGARGVDGIREDVEAPLQLLAGVAGIVLLMACLNLSALLLARGVTRERELSVRRALGASRGRVIRVLMAESLILAALGGACGVLLALWAGPIITSMVASGLGAAGVEFGLDWPLVMIGVAVALAAALMSGVAPALRLSRPDRSRLTERREGGSGSHTGRALIALQIAVSIPLLVGAGLLLRTLHNLAGIELGFNPQDLIVFPVETRLAGNAAEQNPAALYDRVLDRVRALPGVGSATLVEGALASGRPLSNTQGTLNGTSLRIPMKAIGPDFFETMGVPILAGRAINAGDRAGALPVLVIDEVAAATYFPGQSPVGRRLTVGRRDAEIVGVAAATRGRSLRTPPQPVFYDSYAQRSFENFPGLAKMLRSAAPSTMHVVLRASADRQALIAAIPAAVAEVAPELPLREVRTYEDEIDSTIARERMFTRLLVIFGGFAVLLACIGLHGITTYAVARRTSEIGIRLALGAQRGQVLWLILRQVLVVATAGIALGVPIAIAAGPVVASLLFGLAPRDALTTAAAAAAMFVVALGAGWLPARRATGLDPARVLRES